MAGVPPSPCASVLAQKVQPRLGLRRILMHSAMDVLRSADYSLVAAASESLYASQRRRAYVQRTCHGAAARRCNALRSSLPVPDKGSDSQK